MLPKFVLDNLVPIINGKIFRGQEVAAFPGFWDFCDENGGCRIRIVKNGKYVGCADKSFRFRSDPPGQFIPDFRDPEVVQLVKKFVEEKMNV